MKSEIIDNQTTPVFIELRAGFWPRLLSIIVDELIVFLPLMFLSAGLYALSGGWLQGPGFPDCAFSSQINTPAPTRVLECRYSFLGLETRHVQLTISQSQMLDRAGRPINGINTDWVGSVAILAYLIAMQWRTGATIGDRIFGIRVVDLANPSGRGVPAPKIIVRYLAMSMGFAPTLAVLVGKFVIDGVAAPVSPSSPFSTDMAIAGLLGAIWWLVIVVQIVRKRDPIYDKIAGTAALLTYR